MRTMRILSTGLLAATALGVLALGARLPAGERPEAPTGGGRQILEASEGSFDLGFESADCKGTSLSRVGVGGQWLLEHVKAELHGRPYEGRGSTSYDPATGKYFGVWIDSMSPRPLLSEGTYDPATKTLSLVGDMATPDGRTVKATLVTVFKDADTRTFTFKATGPDGKEADLFRISYTRRPK